MFTLAKFFSVTTREIACFYLSNLPWSLCVAVVKFAGLKALWQWQWLILGEETHKKPCVASPTEPKVSTGTVASVFV